jgi:hypothetical protein
MSGPGNYYAEHSGMPCADNVPPERNDIKASVSVNLESAYENAARILTGGKDMGLFDKFYKDLDGDGKIAWYEKMAGVFSAAFHIFQQAEPAILTGLSVAAAITKDPAVIAASNITSASIPILNDVVAAVDSGAASIVVDPVKAQALVDAIKQHGSAVTSAPAGAPLNIMP